MDAPAPDVTLALTDAFLRTYVSLGGDPAGLPPQAPALRWLRKLRVPLRVLNLNNLVLPSMQLTALVSALASPAMAPLLREVESLSYNFGELDDQRGSLVLHLITAALPGLRAVELLGNRVGDNTCGLVRDMLRSGRPALQRLKLGDNQISDLGAVLLSAGLAANSHLVQLHLGSNAVGDAGVTALSQALLENTTLTSLGLRGNTYGAHGANALALLLHHNSAIVDLQLRRSAERLEGND
eukprot:RCo045015